MDRFDNSFFEFKLRRNEILHKLWDLTQNFLDKNSDYSIECRDELELLKKLEDTEEFKNLFKELDSTIINLNQLYIEFINETCSDGLKKDKIIALKEKFGEEIRTSEIATAVGCSKNYARQFYIIDGKVEQKEKRGSLSKKVKREILKRDDNSCVVCGKSGNLQIHHIMAIMGSSISELNGHDNLATLCKECHYLAHNGNYYQNLAYKDIEDFWKWTQNSEKTQVWLILKDIRGIGFKISDNIYYKFKSVESLQNASVRDLVKVPLVNRALAERIKFKVQLVKS